MLLDHRPVEDNLHLSGSQLPERHVGAHAHRAADIHHQRPHQRVPRGDRPLFDGQRRVGDIGGLIGHAHDSGALAEGAGAVAVERERLGPGQFHLGAADRAVQRRHSGNVHRRLLPVPVRAEMPAEPGEHQAHVVQKFGRCAEGAAYVGHSGTLVQRDGRRHVLNAVDLGVGGHGHAAPGVGGKRLQVAPRAFGIQHSQRERTLSRTGDPGYRDLLPKRNLYVYVFEIVDSGATDLDLVYCHTSSVSERLPTIEPQRTKILRFAVQCHGKSLFL